jgi:folate-binding protein YgfZ
MTACLDDRAVLSMSGPDAREFLQGLITNDMGRLSETTPLYAALLTPQGKILFDFLLFARDETILLDCPATTAPDLVKRLSLYRLRAKVDIALRADLGVIASWDGAEHSDLAALDPRLAALGRRAILDRGPVAADHASAKAWLGHRLDLGVPEGADFGHDRMFALDADLDELHGVSFEKGCYVGQELTARMKHRGTTRKRLFPIATLDGSVLESAGAPVTANSRELGEVVSTYGARGFALLRLDRLADADPAALAVDGAAIRAFRPAWLFS